MMEKSIKERDKYTDANQENKDKDELTGISKKLINLIENYKDEKNTKKITIDELKEELKIDE